MHRKISAATLGALMASLALAGCAQSPASEQTDASNDSEVLTMCVVHNFADSVSVTAMVKGMNDEASAYNADITYFDPANDPQKQASMIADCASRQPDVLVVNAVDPEAVIPEMKRASEAGIKILTINADVAEDGQQYRMSFIGSDSFTQGYSVGTMIAAGLNNEGNLVIVGGNPGQTDSVNRTEGVKAAFADLKSNIKIVAEQSANWSQDKALSVTTDLLTRFPDIDAVFGQDDPMAMGALLAVKNSGQTGIKVYGVNGNKEACASVKAGDLAGTALQMSELLGVSAVRAAFDLKNGRLVPDKILAPTAAVTQENISQWESKCW
jgi:ABC-type sugar transport system substrate-binding protein